jgi:hypothetical protein
VTIDGECLHTWIDFLMSKDNLFVSKENLVFCFDLEREEWNKTIIAELNGALCIAQTDLYRDGYSCTVIWLLNDSDRDIWFKVYTIQMNANVDLVQPLRVTRDGSKLLFLYIHQSRPEPMLQVILMPTHAWR